MIHVGRKVFRDNGKINVAKLFGQWCVFLPGDSGRAPIACYMAFWKWADAMQEVAHLLRVGVQA